MNISMPIVAAPRPRVASSGGGRGLRFLTARLAQAVADAGLIPVSRAVDEVNSVSAKHAVADASCSISRPSLLTRRRRSFRFQPVLPFAPGPERESASEDRLPPPPVFVRVPELRHPRPRRIINRAKMATEAFQQLEALVQSAPTPAPVRTNAASPPVATHSAPPYPYPRRRRDMLRPAATHVADAALEILPPTKSRRGHDGSAHRDQVAWTKTMAASPSGRPRPRSHSHGRAVQFGRGADAGGVARRDHARN